MSKGFITGTNEELIKAYKESRDESYLKELIEANKGLINLLVSPYLTSIPNSELEDLTSESYIPMLRAIEDYDPEQGVGLNCLREIQDKYLASSGENCVLMVYNMGESTAKKLWAKDIYSSAYSREVIARAQELRQELTQE